MQQSSGGGVGGRGRQSVSNEEWIFLLCNFRASVCVGAESVYILMVSKNAGVVCSGNGVTGAFSQLRSKSGKIYMHWH